MKKFLQISIFLLIGVQFASAQSLSAYVEAAEEAYANKDYYSSLAYYNEALKLDENNLDLSYKIAESARKFNAYSVAEAKYTSILEMDTESKFPMSTYWLAEMKQRQGKYDEAIVHYQSYISEFAEDGSYYATKADKELKSCEWAKSISETPDESVTINRLGTEVNTPYSEFAGSLQGNKLNYSSMQFEKADDEHRPVRKISKVMTSEDGELGTPVEGGLNGDINSTGNVSYSTDGKYMFYTICDYVNSSDIRCDLYYRSMDGDNYGEAVKLPSFINGAEHTSTQPAFAHDRVSGKDMLFFVSDREGGKGKLDVWYSLINGSMEFSEPVNVSEINTTENEITPFCHESSGELFFSSDGYQGLGGYDVYSVVKKNNSFTKPTHLNPPTNSSYNDIYYSINPDGNVGHLSSNRKGALYLDETNEGCCYDIYKLDIEPIEINLLALTFDKNTNDELHGVVVKLYDSETDELLETVNNETGYDHNFKLERNRCYYIVAEKLTYTPDRVQFCTNNITKSELITKKLFLARDQVTLDVFAFNKETNAGINGCSYTLTDLSDPNNRVAKSNPNGNDVHFDLSPGKKYRLSGSHPLYGTKSMTIDANEADATGKIVKKIYCGNPPYALPLILYFDNDRPGRRSQKTTINKSYTDTYTPYIAKKQEFIKKGVDPAGITNFFEVDVVGGYKKLNVLLGQLQRALSKGERLNIMVKGFASPRAATDYNLKLGQRRVHSLKNEINRYAGGVLSQYLKSGQLKITDVSLGENTAPSGINDQYKNEKLSIYSVEASRERRIEILKVNTVTAGSNR